MKRTEYPLSWPPNWPRTSTYERRPSKFKTSLAGAIANVSKELTRFGKDSGKQVTNIQISSNYALGSQSPKDPGVAVYFTWDGIDTCIAVDRYPKLEDNLQAISLVLEAERTKLRHGGLNLVRASFTGYAALPSSSGPGARPWHMVLGVPEDASAATIRDAYNRKRSASHPDKGGTAEAFREVQTAFDTAKQRGLVA